MTMSSGGFEPATGGPLEPPTAPTVTVGMSVAHYHVLARLGAGGMGVVFEAEDLRLSRHVALKFLPESLARDAASLSRFEREARMASSLNHPHICTIYDVGTFHGSPYIVMELLSGETLRNRIAARPLTADEFLLSASQIVSAVAAAHARRIIHRDLKPANIIVTRESIVKVLDFGLAKSLHDRDDDATVIGPATTPETWMELDAEPAVVTMPGTVLGTAAYMAPEQIAGERVDARSDVFALGVIFYEALAGARPFAGVDTAAVHAQILRHDPVPLTTLNRAIPAPIEQLVMRCIAKRPQARFASAVELQTELAAVKAALGWDASGSGVRQRSRRAWRSERLDTAAVLPFEMRTRDPEFEYLGDAVAEDLMRELSMVPGLRVKARSVVQRYRGQQVTPGAVGRELGVDGVVLGSIARHDRRLSVSVEFVRCDDESLLWSDRITRDAADLLAIEKAVLAPIVREISARLGRGEESDPATRHTPSPEAHDRYLRGRACWHERTPESLRRAIDYFSMAVDADPEYALAFAGLADAYAATVFYDLEPPAEVMPRARAAALRAVESDPELPEAQASRGLVASIWDFDWEESGRRLRRALDLNASLAYVHHWYAMQLSTLGRAEEAYAEIKRALVLDPLATAAQGDALNILIRGRRFDEAVGEARRALALQPRWAAGWAGLGRALQYGGQPAAAIDAFERALAVSPDNVRLRALLGGAYALSHRHAEARAIRKALAGEAATRYIPSYWVALVDHTLGESEQALDGLEQAALARYPQIAYLGVEPIFDTLRAHPRFAALLQQIDIPSAAAATRLPASETDS